MILFFLHPFCSKVKISLQSMNLIILSFRIDVVILYVEGRHVMSQYFFVFGLSFVLGRRYFSLSVGQSEIFSGSLMIF